MTRILADCSTVCVDGHSTAWKWAVMLGTIPAGIVLLTALLSVIAWRGRHHE